MKIIFQSLNVSISTEVLSGGEHAHITQLAEKSKSGKELNSEESSFIKSMASRSNHFVSNY